MYKGLIFNSATVLALKERELAAATPGMEIPREWAEKVMKMLKPDLREIFVAFCKDFPQVPGSMC